MSSINPSVYRILVVDDDIDIGVMMKMMLEYKGYSVSVNDRADEVTKLIHSKNFDLLIMDMLLSGTNGTDLCRHLKQDSATSHFPVIMISAHPNAKQICLDAGADDFISKPFDMFDVLSKIKRLLAYKG
ncbi:MAG: response regulator [Bacteroidota bacterium]